VINVIEILRSFDYTPRFALMAGLRRAGRRGVGEKNERDTVRQRPERKD